MEKAAFYLVSGNPSVRSANKELYMNVMFNPDTYSVESSAEYSPSSNLNSKQDFLQFTKLGARTLTMDLYFDTLNGTSDLLDSLTSVSAQLKDLFSIMPDEDVRSKINKLHKLIELQPAEDKNFRPPVVEFQWGNFMFLGVVTNMKEKYDMFLRNGYPVKATVTLTMREYFGTEDDIKATLDEAKKAAQQGILSSAIESYTESAKQILSSLL